MICAAYRLGSTVLIVRADQQSQHIFMKKSRLKKSSLKISFSYVEILVEEVYDLLVTRRPGDVSLQLL